MKTAMVYYKRGRGEREKGREGERERGEKRERGEEKRENRL